MIDLDWVNSVAFSHDSKWVASRSYDESIRLWCVDNSHSNEVLSKDGAAKDERASTLNSQTNNGIWREKFKTTTNFGVVSIFYHEIDSRSFLVTGGDNGSVCLWEHDRAAEKIALLWSSCHLLLCAIDATLTSSTLLSKDTRELLKQRGGGGKEEEQEAVDDVEK